MGSAGQRRCCRAYQIGVAMHKLNTYIVTVTSRVMAVELFKESCRFNKY